MSAQDKYIRLLENCLLDDIYESHTYTNQPATKEQVDQGSIWLLRAHTMIGRQRLRNIENCVRDVVTNDVKGDFIETGVWRGGACIFMKGLIDVLEEKNGRKVFVADSFEGLPPPDEKKYPVDTGDIHHTYKLLAVDVDTVKNNFKAYNLLDDRVIFIKGFFEFSLVNAPIEKLAILRLDGDMYSSTIQVLEALYDKVEIGGHIIIDDYALPGCRKAIDDFRCKRNITTPMVVADWTGRSWKKEL